MHKVLYNAPKTQVGWLNLPHLTILPQPVTAKHRVVKFQTFPGNRSEQGIPVDMAIELFSIQTVQRLHLKWRAARNYHSVENASSNKNVSVYS